VKPSPVLSNKHAQGQDRQDRVGARGFTIIELMVTIVIASILIALAGPSFSSLTASQRAKGAASELYATLAKARSEAITRNATVTVSPVSSNWANGWQIVAPSSVVVDNHGATTGVTITGPTSFVYRTSGRASAAQTFVITGTAGSANSSQCVSVDLTGRPYITAGTSC
jgi:type IV fimbrial biogenesis protein FimT